MKLEKLVEKAVDLYKNNRMVNINANVLAAAFPSIAAATGTSELMEYAGHSKEAIAVGAAIADWAVYIPVQIGLHYKANKKQFIDDENFNKKEFFKDVGHVYITQLPSIGLFYLMAGPFHYYLMDKKIGSGLANQISYWGTMTATRLVHTIIGTKTGLFKKRNS